MCAKKEKGLPCLKFLPNARTLLEGQRRRPSINGAGTWCKLGILTDDTYNGTAGFNTYGGAINIESKTENNKRVFTIEYTGVPQDACVKLGTSDWGGDSSSGLISIKVNDAAEYTWKAETSENAEGGDRVLPPSVTQVSEDCKDKVSNAIKWTYN